jgi:hypothetical protein
MALPRTIDIIARQFLSPSGLYYSNMSLPTMTQQLIATEYSNRLTDLQNIHKSLVPDERQWRGLSEVARDFTETCCKHYLFCSLSRVVSA